MQGKKTNKRPSAKAEKMQQTHVKREQPRKDSNAKRVNYDNIREDKVKKIIERGAKQEDANDIAWYTRNPELIKAAASIPFSTVLGEIAHLEINTHIPAPGGIMVLPWCPCLSNDNTAINQAINSMYSYIVHANSRNYAYDAPDLGILILAGIQCFSIVGAMTRAYGTVKYYQERNLYLPDGLLQAMGFNANDMRTRLAQIWFDINNLIDQLRQIWIPNTIPLTNRWYWMNTNMFTDAEGVTAQVYMYVQDRYFIYEETAVKTGSALFPVSSLGGSQTDITLESFDPAHNVYDWNVWRLVAQSMIDALINSQDRGIIFGDILNAYGQDNIMALASIPSDFMVMPQYNAEVLTQIENYCGSHCQVFGFAQRIEEGITTLWTRDPWFNGVNAKLLQGNTNWALLNFHIPTQPTPEMITIATRMTAVGYYSQNGPVFSTSNQQIITDPILIPKCCGTELPHPILLYRRIMSGGIIQYKAYQISSYESGSGASSSMTNDAKLMMAFDWHPFQIKFDKGWSVPNVGTVLADTDIRDAYGDFDNYAWIDRVVLDRLHRACAYSLLGVPHF